MDISRVAKAANLPASTLRYYEEQGLIHSIGRQGIRRVFNDKVVDELAFISLARRAGFSLDEIRKMITPKGPRVDRQALLSKADELDKRIDELCSIRDGLRHSAACKAKDHFACPTFRRLLNIARKKRPAPQG